MKMRDYRLGYRGDIEGLRAVAILLVVAAHAYVPWLAGGFVGVDVFFVLSGYLITGLILQEIERTGHLRFGNFYARRLRRLLPALLVMLVCTCVVAAITLAPDDQGSQAISAATASIWFSNIHFAFDKLDYFSPDATSNLFLHTWSLGVEEQFYLVWPSLMVWALATGTDKPERIKRLKITMCVIAASSLAACIVLTRTTPQMAFYMMPLRAWQFAAGALVWLYCNPSKRDTTSRASSSDTNFSLRWCGWIGLVLIVVCGVWFDANSVYPGWRALLPTAGAAAILAAGVGPSRSGASRALSWFPLQTIGRVSYSWYLWHWPVLLLGGALFGDRNPLHRALFVALSLAIAAASYRWVEAPVRLQARWTARPHVTIVAAIMAMIVCNVLCIAWFNATRNWATSPAQQRYVQAHSDAPIIYSMGCDEWFHSATVRPCVFGPDDAPHTAVLMGDSVGAQWFSAAAMTFNRPGWRLLVLTKSACPMIDASIFYPRIGREYTECNIWRNEALRQVVAWHPDIVMLGSDSAYDLDQAKIVEGTTRLLKVVGPAAGHVYIVRGTPHLPFDGPACLSSRNWLPWLHPSKNKCMAAAYSKSDDDVYQSLQQAARRLSNVTPVDMNDVVCPAGTCHAESHGVIVFRDSRHLTDTYVQSLSEDFGRKLDMKPLAGRAIDNPQAHGLQKDPQ